jgi:uncharacterized protein YbjT (DUF2867 family)
VQADEDVRYPALRAVGCGERSVRVLLTGATGLIGSAVLARLVADGHDVVAVTRRARPGRCQAPVRWIAVDMARAATAEAWAPHLDGIDAAVNCAGVLQDGPGDSTSGVHVAGAVALFAALERAGVRRVVHVSAIGIDRNAVTAFSASKLAGDEALMARDLDWIVLRPSVVVGAAAYGGSAFLRALAALPVAPRLPDAGLVQVVQLQDLAETVACLLRPDAPARLLLEVCGPERLELDDIIAAYRQWLGLGQARPVPVPRWLVRAACRLGDAAGLLGWRPPVRTTARLELARGAVGNPAPWTRITGIEPKSLARALAETPASVQERWFAQLYFAKPVMLAALSLVWLVTGLVTLGPAWDAGLALRAAGAPAEAAPPLAAVGAAADIIVGLGIAVRRTAGRALRASLALSGFYLAAGTALAPALWGDPLGPLLKIVPIMALSLAALAIADDR